MKIGKSKSLLTPNGNSYVWRYMSMRKFERLMEDQSLYFCNAQRLSDQYEVTIPESTINSWRKQLIVSGHDPKSVEREIASRLNTWQIGEIKARTLINCWSISPHESYALWKIYLNNKPEGVAIQTTVSRLKKSLLTGDDPHPETVYLGQVRYRNHLKLEELSQFDIITTKKKFYDFEHELRLFIANEPVSNSAHLPFDLGQGRNVQVDLKQLIHRVYVSPFSNGSFHSSVESLLNSKQIEVEKLRESEIRDT
jgi:hypothetical protein